jgi:hypothetical protein
MMYWIVFALFTAIETFLDILMSWFPFYYEIKILFILWVLSPVRVLVDQSSSCFYSKIFQNLRQLVVLVYYIKKLYIHYYAQEKKRLMILLQKQNNKDIQHF